MPDITAYLIVGTVSPVRGFMPTHWAYLIEGTGPVWHIAPCGIFTKENTCKSRWPTSEETVVHDAMAMVSTVVERLPSLSAIIDKAVDREHGECVDLARLSAASRQKLTLLNQKTEHEVHLVMTVLADSIVYADMHNFTRYPVSVDICTPQYSQDGSLLKFKWPKRKKRQTSPDSAQLN